MRVSAPPDPQGLREGVQTDIDGLFLLLGGISVLVGAIGIANVTLVSVMERIGEIGVPAPWVRPAATSPLSSAG